MRAFQATVTRTVEEVATLTVHAGSRNEAKNLAMQQAEGAGTAWARGDVYLSADAEEVSDPELEARKEAAHEAECRSASMALTAERRRNHRRSL